MHKMTACKVKEVARRDKPTERKPFLVLIKTLFSCWFVGLEVDRQSFV